MFNRLLSWWRRRQQQKHRGIFHFWDGQRERAADPFEIHWAIAADPEFNLDRDSALMQAGDVEASQKAVRCVHRAFGVKPFDQGGLLADECLLLIEEFYEFAGALKKNTSDSPISSPPTALESSTASTDPDPIPGKSSSDLPKTPSEAN